MAINIGNDAMLAVAELRGNPDFVRLMGLLELIAQKYIYGALDTTVEMRVHHTAHAKGIYELVEALNMALSDKRAAQLTKPPPPKNRREFAE